MGTRIALALLLAAYCCSQYDLWADQRLPCHCASQEEWGSLILDKALAWVRTVSSAVFCCALVQWDFRADSAQPVSVGNHLVNGNALTLVRLILFFRMHS